MEELLNKVAKYLERRSKTPIEFISNELELEEYQIYGLIDILSQRGYSFQIIDKMVVKMPLYSEQKEHKIPIKAKNGELKFLALSDIHYGSKWDNPKYVDYAYELAEKENCQFITNSGDIFEGDFHSKRPEHIYQVKALGMEQLDYVADKYPHSELPTYFITGNHDATFTKTCGADIGKMLADKRPDLTYLGHDIGDLKVGNILLRLRHGNGGGSYAKSYKLQKYCETLPLNDIPNIILQGHYHYSAYFKNRDIHCINVPSLQSYTPYAKSLGLPQEIGFWEITCNLDNKDQIVSIIPELYNFDEKTPKLAKRKK